MYAYKVVCGFPLASLGLFEEGHKGSVEERGMHKGNPVADRILET